MLVDHGQSGLCPGTERFARLLAIGECVPRSWCCDDVVSLVFMIQGCRRCHRATKSWINAHDDKLLQVLAPCCCCAVLGRGNMSPNRFASKW